MAFYVCGSLNREDLGMDADLTHADLPHLCVFWSLVGWNDGYVVLYIVFPCVVGTSRIGRVEICGEKWWERH